MEEYLITINDNKNIGNYTKLVDVIQPKNAQYAYLSITKFQASVQTLFATIPNNVVLSLDAATSSFSNDSFSNTIVSSRLIDIFSTNTYISKASGDKFAYYNYEANHTNWIKINISSLSNLKFSFKTCSNYVDLVNPISYVDLPNFPFTLQFKIKFE